MTNNMANHITNRILSLEDMTNFNSMSTDNLIDLYKLGYRIDTNSNINTLQTQSDAGGIMLLIIGGMTLLVFTSIIFSTISNINMPGLPEPRLPHLPGEGKKKSR